MWVQVVYMYMTHACTCTVKIGKFTTSQKILGTSLSDMSAFGRACIEYRGGGST